MNWFETFRAGAEAVRAHRLRSVLTMLGIVIGISSVILTVGLGQGAQDQVRQQISALGSNLLIVSPGSSTDSSGLRGGFGSASTLTLQDATAIGDDSVVPDAARVAPTTSTSTALAAGETNWTSSVVGTTTSWLDVRARDLSAGRFFTEAEVEQAADVVVLGPDTASELFERGSPVGQTVTVDSTPMTVIGVLESSGASSSGTSEDDQAVVPISTAKRLTGTATSSVSTIYVEAASADALTAAYQEINALLLTLHGVGADEADFSISTQDSLVETANSTNETLTVLLGGIAAISLLVGGIGVMNIMLVSVTERVREIGLRKALGATPRVIRRQFLVEASLLGFTGGLVGVLVGVVGAQVLPGLIDQPVSISLVATLGAIGTALALGIGFGVYPASRAARLTPIDALRSE
ncbi:ABC transporter permease [Nocardioides lianchengensis]|uniref:Putative ABC transport system permease protein n=1 Tax=Nocardioides lianchengensis TaxID=1045774 RepID=A0A1G6N0C4_9ACTN|nr:ABC transporter permease [Nocardioides lianchengensis]NYG10601.1 putative ABC transport system permease protein [Nocardioides lianchengensis]SDC60924.1 putative ABC transport system permease protein [Nocardioides lianchengensis]